MPGAAGIGLVAQAAPAHQGRAGLLQQPLRQGHAAQSLRPAAPLMTGEGIDVGGSGSLSHRHAAHGLGRIHQQPGLAGVIPQPLRHRLDRHHGAGVPEQMGEHHQAGVIAEVLVQAGQHRIRQQGFRRGAAELLHRQGGELQSLTAREFPTGRHHAGMLTVADQQNIALLPRQAP